MKKGDTYKHYKGGIYTFIGIAVPTSIPVSEGHYFYRAKHSEDLSEVRVYRVNGYGDVYATNLEEPAVLYKSTKDGQLWVRPVDMFFDHKWAEPTKLVKRFEKLT